MHKLTLPLLGLLLAACTAQPGNTQATIEYEITRLVAEQTVTAAARPSETPTPVITTETPTPVPSSTPTPTQTPLPGPQEPHGDGIYLSGSQIAFGTWQSDGQAEGDCYWTTRLADGIIHASYLGAPGGRITIRAVDYEVMFENCGTWTYLGP